MSQILTIILAGSAFTVGGIVLILPTIPALARFLSEEA